MSTKLADEIRMKYATPHYTFEDVTNEIRRFVLSSYEYVAKYKFQEWPGYGVRYSDSVPYMKWDSSNGTIVNHVRWLLIPKGSCDFDLGKVDDWFKEQGFIFTKDEHGNNEGWRIKF